MSLITMNTEADKRALAAAYLAAANIAAALGRLASEEGDQEESLRQHRAYTVARQLLSEIEADIAIGRFAPPRPPGTPWSPPTTPPGTTFVRFYFGPGDASQGEGGATLPLPGPSDAL